jgi:predicted DsbA family dithiol-disulfide isomerase
MPRPVQIDVFADVVCPWCYIGRKRLGRAMAAEPPGSFVTLWRAFELQPDMPEKGLPAQAFFAGKFGGAARMNAIFERVVDAGREEGIAFDFAAQRVAPNTRLAHRAIQLAPDPERQTATVDACFKGHFEEGTDIGDLDQLVALIARHVPGADAAELAGRLERGEGKDEVLADEDTAAELGIGGVPFFIANQKLGLSGAQPAEVFTAFLTRAREEATRGEPVTT